MPSWRVGLTMGFDPLAPHYRWMEFVLAGNKLQRCRTAFLSRANQARNILLMGEGNGRFLIECRRRLKQARITCVDNSGRMLESARQRLVRCGLSPSAIEFIQADALAWSPPSRAFDLIVTHFFLDCFQPHQLERIVALLAGAARPGATWLLADFQIPPAGFSRCRAKLIHWSMYRFFRVVTGLPAMELTAPEPFLNAHGFSLQERQCSEWGLLHSDYWQAGPAAEEAHFPLPCAGESSFARSASH